jgi:hypothetical protein
LRPGPTTTVLAVAVLGGLVFAAQNQPAASTSKKSAAPGKSNKSTAKKAAPRTAASKAAPPVRHYAPQQPSTDRLKEIQQALADRGYFKGSVDGQWGQESVDALKQFQHEQKIDEDGKINSLSLIALGLGPHRNLPVNQSARSTPAPNVAEPTPEATPAAETVRSEDSSESPDAVPVGP